MVRRLLIGTVIGFWALMMGLFVKREYVSDGIDYGAAGGAALDSEYHMGVYYGQRRIGEFHFNSYPLEDSGKGGYRLVSSLQLDYAPVGEASIVGESLTDEDVVLREFHYHVNYKLKMFEEEDAILDGTLRGGKLLLKVKWGAFERSFELPAEEGISLYDPLTPWIAGGRFVLGREHRIGVFNHLTRSRQVAKVKVLRSRKISYGGKEIPGLEVETVVGEMKSIFWVGRDGKVYRMESPIGICLMREPNVEPVRERF